MYDANEPKCKTLKSLKVNAVLSKKKHNVYSKALPSNSYNN